MAVLYTFLLSIGLIQKSYSVLLPCSNNCLPTSQHKCETLPCLNGCNRGWHGDHCNKPCIQSCLHYTCNQDDGACAEIEKPTLFKPKEKPRKMRSSDKCLEADIQQANKCICCASMYRGDTCETVCKQCKTIYVKESKECHYLCQSGYYGTTCNKTCPHSCSIGVKGYPVCEEVDSVVKCVGCTVGRHGNICEKKCSNCKKDTCIQATGYCRECIDGYYGRDCDITCNAICINKLCSRNGTCLKGCVNDMDCVELCPVNCNPESSHVCDKANGSLICTHGCLDGFYGPKCQNECPRCEKCHQSSGECLALNKSASTESSKDPSNIHLVIISILCPVVLIVIGVVVIKVYLRKTNKNLSDFRFFRCLICPDNSNPEPGSSKEEEQLLTAPGNNLEDGRKTGEDLMAVPGNNLEDRGKTGDDPLAAPEDSLEDGGKTGEIPLAAEGDNLEDGLKAEEDSLASSGNNLEDGGKTGDDPLAAPEDSLEDGGKTGENPLAVQGDNLEDGGKTEEDSLASSGKNLEDGGKTEEDSLASSGNNLEDGGKTGEDPFAAPEVHREADDDQIEGIESNAGGLHVPREEESLNTNSGEKKIPSTADSEDKSRFKDGTKVGFNDAPPKKDQSNDNQPEGGSLSEVSSLESPHTGGDQASGYYPLPEGYVKDTTMIFGNTK